MNLARTHNLTKLAGALLITHVVALLQVYSPLNLGLAGLVYPAAFLTAALFGFWPAVLEILLTSLITYFVAFPPRFTLDWRTPDDTVRLAIYAVTAIAISWFLERGRRTKADSLRAQHDSESHRQRLDDFFTKVPTPVAVLMGPELRFELANAEYERLIGAGRSIAGLTVPEVFPDLPSSLEQVLPNVLATGERFAANEYPLTISWGRSGEPQTKILNFIYEPLRNRAGIVEGIMVFAYEVTELVRAREAVLESERQSRAYAEAMPQMAFIADAAGNISYFNQRWYEYIGLPPGETEGWGWKNYPLHHPEDLEHTLEVWNAALRTGKPYEVEYRLRRHDGIFRWHLGRAIPVRDQHGAILRWFGTNTDIHDQKLAQEELAFAVRSRDEFLSVAAHELRTPVTSFLLQTQIRQRQLERVGRDYFSETRLKEMVQQDHRQALRLARLMDDILDVSLLARKNLELRLQQLDLGAFTQDVCEQLRPTFVERNVELHVHTVPGVLVHLDPPRLERALTNLLTNALKYGNRTPVTVTVNADGKWACVAVADRGPGIAPADHERIFGRFERAVTSLDASGLGLGLFISREIAIAHHGSLSVRSEPGHGATFEIRLPLSPLSSARG